MVQQRFKKRGNQGFGGRSHHGTSGNQRPGSPWVPKVWQQAPDALKQAFGQTAFGSGLKLGADGRASARAMLVAAAAQGLGVPASEITVAQGDFVGQAA